MVKAYKPETTRSFEAAEKRRAEERDAMQARSAVLGAGDSVLPLQAKVTVISASAAKRAIVSDLIARKTLLENSARDAPHDEKGRVALLLAVRVLEVAIANISDNLVCF